MRNGANPMLITGKMMWTMVVMANCSRLARTGSIMPGTPAFTRVRVTLVHPLD